MSETTEPDELREILSKLSQYRDETLQKPDYMDVAEAEAAIRQYFAARLPEKKPEKNGSVYLISNETYNQALDDCRRAIIGENQ